eukprot:scaffold136782_cov99-Phaeocystis_antarctica.AAC.1
MGDMNTVPEARDRKCGKLQPYDDNADAPWRVLAAQNFDDVHRMKMGDDVSLQLPAQRSRAVLSDRLNVG